MALKRMIGGNRERETGRDVQIDQEHDLLYTFTYHGLKAMRF